jgi:hypothetical protein
MILSFGGYAPSCQEAPREFSRLIEKHFPNEETLYLADRTCSTYHRGLEGLTTTIESTVAYIREQIAGRDNVIFIGTSGGGYGAILFGSLLEVNHVVAFFPPTILYKADKDPTYKNLSPHINSTTQYHIFGDLSVKDPNDCHHIRHCENICVRPNVHLVRKDRVDLKQMRESGELVRIFKTLIKF